jgi:hypothetical protein
MQSNLFLIKKDYQAEVEHICWYILFSRIRIQSKTDQMPGPLVNLGENNTYLSKIKQTNSNHNYSEEVYSPSKTGTVPRYRCHYHVVAQPYQII